MPTFKVRKITFGDPPFRKLGNITIEFADRVSVIAGHNGVGKSTIMALVANQFGVGDHKSLFGRAFRANLNEIIHIDFKGEFLVPKENGQLPEPIVECVINGKETIRKACSLTQRQERQEVRVVPRNIPLKDLIFDGDVKIGRDTKIPLPTIYLGMTRMLPVGEANPEWVLPSQDQNIPAQEAAFISRFINNVVVGGQASKEGITSLGVRGTKKVTKHPKYTYDARCISLGQDTLSSIATALASFQKLKREWEEYPGGLLVIDEVDAGLHPHAQLRLVNELKSAARALSLQVIATTHSTHVVEAVHPDGLGDPKKPDAVIYLMDTKAPRLIEDNSLRQILDNMHLRPPAPAGKQKRKEIKVYFEDDEAALVFGKLVTAAFKRAVGAKYGVKITPMPLGLGCSNMINLSKKDKYFKTVVIAVDADAEIKGVRDTSNIVRLPGGKAKGGKGLSPERTLHQFIDAIANHPLKHKDTLSKLAKIGVTTDHLSHYLLHHDHNIDNRDGAKIWWRERVEYISNWKLWELWASDNDAKVMEFLDQLEKAIATVAKRSSIGQ